MANEHQLRMWFQSVDADRSGQVNATELQRALQTGNLNFPASIVEQMIRMYDRDMSGKMSFEEFVKLHKFLCTVQESFSRHEKMGKLQFNQNLYPALQEVGFHLDQTSFRTVCYNFDKTKSASFRLDDFMSICIFLQSAQNLFSAFDSQRKGHLSLDFNQFVYCSANLKF